MIRAVAAALLATSLLGAGAAPAAGPPYGKELRPPLGGSFAYLAPAETFGSANVVVHWVARGAQAPPLNDDDSDAVPDFVEAASAAAESALEAYGQRGFRRPPADTGGPDGRIDLYISELPFGMFGVMATARASSDGAFVVLSSQLDRREPVAIASLKATVAHEVFHLVQHAYAFHHLPDWVLEGSADAMASIAAPEAVEWLNALGIERWNKAASTTPSENDPYGSAPWWTFLEQHDRGFLVALLEQRERLSGARADADADAYGLLDEVHRRRTGISIDRRFQQFAARLAVSRRLTLGVLGQGERRLGRLSSLAIRAYRLKLPAQTTALTLDAIGPNAPALQLILRSGRTIVAAAGTLRARQPGGRHRGPHRARGDVHAGIPLGRPGQAPSVAAPLDRGTPAAAP